MVERKVINTCYLDWQVLQTLGLFNDAVWMLENIRRGCFMEMAHSTYIASTLEFFSSPEVKVSLYTDSDPGQITLCVANMEHTLTLQQLNQIFGFPKDGTRFSPHEYTSLNSSMR